jgi:putative SOS response-associated peptidase YedK
LVPSWTRGSSRVLINAKAETAAYKPAFRDAFRRRRCLIPADGFSEGLPAGRRTQPFLFRRWDEAPFAFAGLWDAQPLPGPEGKLLQPCALLTTEANELVRPVHERMPVILDPRHYAEWLDPGLTDPAALLPWLQPYSSEALTAFPVRDFVNDPRNEGLTCALPVGTV